MTNELIKKYQAMNDAVKASIWFTICSFLQKAISMITTPIFTRLMTPVEYGKFSIFQSWYGIIHIIVTLSVASGVFNNGMVKYDEDREKYTSSVQGLTTLSTGIFFAAYLVATEYFNRVLDLSTLSVCLLFLYCLFELPFSIWSAKQRFEFKYRLLVFWTILISVLSPLISAIAVIFENNDKASARIISFVAVHVCFGLGFYIYNIIKGRKFYEKEYWRYTISLAVPLIPHYLSMIVLQQADRIMIGRMSGVDKAAIYSVAYSVSTIATTFINSINSSFVPYIYQSLKKGLFSGIRSTANYLIVFVGIISVLMMTLGPEIISIFAPKEYYEAIWIIPPVAVSVFFQFLYSLYSNVELYYEKKWYITIASVCGAGLNIILNYIFIRQYGYIAAGYTTLFCYAMFSIFHYVIYRRVIKKEISKDCQIYDIRFQLLSSFVITILMFVILCLYHSQIIRYVVAASIMIGLFLFRNQIVQTIKKVKTKEI